MLFGEGGVRGCARAGVESFIVVLGMCMCFGCGQSGLCTNRFMEAWEEESRAGLFALLAAFV